MADPDFRRNFGFKWNYKKRITELPRDIYTKYTTKPVECDTKRRVATIFDAEIKIDFSNVRHSPELAAGHGVYSA